METAELTEHAWTMLTFERMSHLESADTDDEVFRRRMGMRTYFKELKMSMQRIEETKIARAKNADGTVTKTKAKKKKTKSTKPKP